MFIHQVDPLIITVQSSLSSCYRPTHLVSTAYCTLYPAQLH